MESCAIDWSCSWLTHCLPGWPLISDNNTIGGTLPTELGQLKELQFLDLCKCLAHVEAIFMLIVRRSNGFIFPILGWLRIIDSNVVDNQIEGSIPTEVGAMRSMNAIFLGRCFVVLLSTFSSRPNRIALVLAYVTGQIWMSYQGPYQVNWVYLVICMSFYCVSFIILALMRESNWYFRSFFSPLGIYRWSRKQQTKWIFTNSNRPTGEAKRNSIRYALSCYVCAVL